MMIWLDFTVAVLLMWGAVSGYQAGFRKAICRLGGVLGAALTALLSRADLKCFAMKHSILEKVIADAVYSRMAIPVGGSTGQGGCLWALPGVLRNELLKGPALAAGGSTDYISALLVQLLVYTVSFLAGLAVWWGFFQLGAKVFYGRKSCRSGKISRWGGALFGLIRQFCVAAMAIGVAVPLAWLCRVPSGLLQLEKTLMACWAWNLFTSLGIWR